MAHEILIVDDEIKTAKILQDQLELITESVCQVCQSGEKALKMIGAIVKICLFALT